MCGYSTDVPIQPGQEICLPGWMDACQFVVQSDPERPYCKAYQVQEGDTLASIANTFNASVDWLVRACSAAAPPLARVLWANLCVVVCMCP